MYSLHDEHDDQARQDLNVHEEGCLAADLCVFLVGETLQRLRQTLLDRLDSLEVDVLYRDLRIFVIVAWGGHIAVVVVACGEQRSDVCCLRR